MEHHIGFSVKNLKKMCDFYHDIFSFSIVDGGIREGKDAARAFGLTDIKYQIVRALPPKGEFFIQFLYFMNISQKEQSIRSLTDLGFNHIGIEVDNIEQIYNILQTNHIKTESPPILQKSGAKLLFTHDPEGNIIEVIEFPKK